MALRGLCAATALCDVGFTTVTTAYAVGGLAGGAVNGRPVIRVGRERAVLPAGAAPIAALLAMGTVRSPAALAVSLAVCGATGMVGNVNTTPLMQQRTSADLRSAASGPSSGPSARRGRPSVPSWAEPSPRPGYAHAGPARRRLLRRVGRHADTGAQGGRICCCAGRPGDDSSCSVVIN